MRRALETLDAAPSVVRPAYGYGRGAAVSAVAGWVRGPGLVAKPFGDLMRQLPEDGTLVCGRGALRLAVGRSQSSQLGPITNSGDWAKSTPVIVHSWPLSNRIRRSCGPVGSVGSSKLSPDVIKRPLAASTSSLPI